MQSWYWLLLLWLVFAALPLRLPRRPAAVARGGGCPPRWARWEPPRAVVSGMLTDTLTGQDVDYRIDNPIGIDGLPGVEEQALFPVFSGLFVVGVVDRGRRGRRPVPPVPRGRAAADEVVPLRRRPAAPAALRRRCCRSGSAGVVFVWLLLALPVAVAVAVLRYRLDDIDVVINRTLVYGALTVVVVGDLRAGRRLPRRRPAPRGRPARLAGRDRLVAVLFAPLRERLQRAVNRLLYGERDEPYAALSRLGERLESTLAPDAVLPTIVSTVREALRLPYAAIALGRRRAAGRTPASRSARHRRRCRCCYQGRAGRAAGRWACAPGESGFSAADRRLLGDLARQAGVAVPAVRLTADLQRSRERLVTAREEERRRLRRDLHDGLGAQLAGLTRADRRAARAHRRATRTAADALAAELRAELRTAIADIRRLVHGLRPPALDELGLVGALQRLAERIGRRRRRPARHRRRARRRCRRCRPRSRWPPTGSRRRR